MPTDPATPLSGCERALVRVGRPAGWQRPGGCSRCRLGPHQSGDDGEDDARYQRTRSAAFPGLAGTPSASCTSRPAAPPAMSPLKVCGGAQLPPSSAPTRAPVAPRDAGSTQLPSSWSVMAGSALTAPPIAPARPPTSSPTSARVGARRPSVGQRQPDRQGGPDDRPGCCSPSHGEGDEGFAPRDLFPEGGHQLDNEPIGEQPGGEGDQHALQDQHARVGRVHGRRWRGRCGCATSSASREGPASRAPASRC